MTTILALAATNTLAPHSQTPLREEVSHASTCTLYLAPRDTGLFHGSPVV